MALYALLNAKIQVIELKLSQILEKRLQEPYAPRLFYFNVIGLNVVLILCQIAIDTYKFFIILFADPGNSFNLFFRQRELRSCPFSYAGYKQIQRKVRMFSLLGISSMVIVAVATSLVTNLLFGGKQPTFAASFGWTQNSWSDGIDPANMPTHSENKDGLAGWSKFLSSSNVDFSGGNLKISLASSSVSTDNFAADSGSNFYLDGNTPRLKKQNGAGCSSGNQCASSGCGNDFTDQASKNCHAANHCTDLNNSWGNYQQPTGYKKCSGNSYYKACQADGTWGATSSNPSVDTDCAAQGDPAKGGYALASESVCVSGSGAFAAGACHTCANGLVANASKTGCNANCDTNDDSKCISGYHCYATDSTCRSNAAGNPCDAHSDCSSGICSAGLCQS